MLSSARKHVMGGVAPVRKARSYGEAQDQRRVVAWLRARPAWLVLRVENAAKRSMAAAARDKAMGMLGGAPDLIVMFHSFSFYIEMKTADGRLSEVQKRVHAELRERGQCVLVGWGAERTIAALTEIDGQAGLPLREIIKQASEK